MLCQEAGTPIGFPGSAMVCAWGIARSRELLILPSMKEPVSHPINKAVAALLKLCRGISFRVKGKTPQKLVHFMEEQDWAGQSRNIRITHLPSG